MPLTGLGLTGVQRALTLLVPMFLYYIPILDILLVISYIIIVVVMYLYTLLLLVLLSFLTGEVL